MILQRTGDVRCCGHTDSAFLRIFIVAKSGVYSASARGHVWPPLFSARMSVAGRRRNVGSWRIADPGILPAQSQSRVLSVRFQPLAETDRIMKTIELTIES